MERKQLKKNKKLVLFSSFLRREEKLLTFLRREFFFSLRQALTESSLLRSEFLFLSLSFWFRFFSLLLGEGVREARKDGRMEGGGWEERRWPREREGGRGVNGKERRLCTSTHSSPPPSLWRAGRRSTLCLCASVHACESRKRDETVRVRARASYHRRDEGDQPPLAAPSGWGKSGDVVTPRGLLFASVC